MKRTLILSLVFVALGMSAQQPVPLPIDSDIRYGQLPNGLAYCSSHEMVA